MSELRTKINETISYISNLTKLKPVVGVVLGTGLGGLVDEIDIESELSYEYIPNFPVSTVESHAGKLIFGYIANKPVVICREREILSGG